MIKTIFKRIIRVIKDMHGAIRTKSVFGFGQDVGNWLDQYISEDNRKTKLIVILSALGIVLFLVAAISLPFKDQLFNLLYPKPRSQAGVCDGKSSIPAVRSGFVYTGGDLNQEITALNTSLYYTYDSSLGPGKQVHMIGKYTANYADPLSLSLLMGDNLSNTEFKGLGGKIPAGWTFLTAGGSGEAEVETATEHTIDSQTSVRIINHKSPSGTQLAQSFKETIKEGDMVVFGTWVKTSTPEAVKFFLQEDKASYREFSQNISSIKSGKWNFILGYGQVPAGITNFQLVLRVTGQENTAWFDRPVAVVIHGKSNQVLAKLVSERCGSAWFIDNEPGIDATTDPYMMEPVSAEVYALIYQQFYQTIKEADSAAVVLPGGLTTTFLDAWRSASKKFFNTEPALDALNIHYLASSSNQWSDESDLQKYLAELNSYMSAVPGWQGKPIWISQLGVSSAAPGGGVDFLKASLKFLEGNNLNIAKWFWFDTCGLNSNLSPLFEAKNKICSWPNKLTKLGKAYVVPKPTPTSIPSVTPSSSSTSSAQIQAPTPTATALPTLIPSPVSTASASTLPAPEEASPTGGGR